jgi:hypothetical protein
MSQTIAHIGPFIADNQRCYHSNFGLRHSTSTQRLGDFLFQYFANDPRWISDGDSSIGDILCDNGTGSNQRGFTHRGSWAQYAAAANSRGMENARRLSNKGNRWASIANLFGIHRYDPGTEKNSIFNDTPRVM